MAKPTAKGTNYDRLGPPPIGLKVWTHTSSLVEWYEKGLAFKVLETRTSLAWGTPLQPIVRVVREA